MNSSGSQESEEGCLSVPGFLGNIKRKLNVVVEAQDRDGNEMEIEASDLFSRVLQHEIDHLDGILFFDRMSKLRKEFFIKKLDKAFGLK